MFELRSPILNSTSAAQGHRLTAVVKSYSVHKRVIASACKLHSKMQMILQYVNVQPHRQALEVSRLSAIIRFSLDNLTQITSNMFRIMCTETQVIKNLDV